jgi:hypothetical protein
VSRRAGPGGPARRPGARGRRHRAGAPRPRCGHAEDRRHRGRAGDRQSRLLAELAGEAGQGGALVLAGRAAELERDLPFALLVDALDAAAAAHADTLSGLGREVLAELAGVLPALGRATAATPGVGHGERHRTTRAFRALLQQLAADRPVTLVLLAR